MPKLKSDQGFDRSKILADYSSVSVNLVKSQEVRI